MAKGTGCHGGASPSASVTDAEEERGIAQGLAVELLVMRGLALLALHGDVAQPIKGLEGWLGPKTLQRRGEAESRSSPERVLCQQALSLRRRSSVGYAWLR